MKKIQFITIVILVMAISGGWVKYFSDIITVNTAYAENIKLARNKVEKGLYQESFTYFNKAKDLKPNKQLWNEYYDAYETYFEKYHDFNVRDDFLKMLEEACKYNPDEGKFFYKQIEIYLEEKDYKNARDRLRITENKISRNEELDKLKTKVNYAIKDDFNEYAGIKCGNNYLSIQTYSGYKLVDTTGNPCDIADKSFISVPGDDDVILITDTTGESSFSDIKNITHGFVRFEFTDAGRYINGLIPIKSKESGSYAFYNIDGEKVLGDYDYASSFCDGIAAVKNDNEWSLINDQGEKILDTVFSDIKINHFNQAVYKSLFAAAEDGIYNLYSVENGKISSIDAEEMDEVCEGKYIAYKKDDEFSFMDISGSEVSSPKYTEAHSFSNGLAAVKIDEYWGFIDEKFNVVIEPQFMDGGYFYPSGTAVVAKEGSRFELLKLFFGLPED